MLPIAEIVRLARCLDADYRCALADSAAVAWGYSSARFVRSSATHVFISASAVDRKRIVLRMRPGNDEALLRSARWAAALYDAGAPVARPVPSEAGRLVEHVNGYAVTALEEVVGEEFGSEDVDQEVAWRWGRLLADFHLRGLAIDIDGAPAPALPSADQSLPRRGDVYGVLHGDPEIDNAVWSGRQGTYVDLDDVHHGWFVADVGFALRDWAQPAQAPDLEAPVPAAFIDGYRNRRPLTDEELSWLPLLARVTAAETLTRLASVLSAPAEVDWPTWAHELDDRVRAQAAQLQAALAT